MQGSKLIEIFYTLTATERRALHKFVHSPYYNKREDVLLLLSYLEQQPNASAETLAKDKVFEYVFPNESYDKAADHKIRYVMSFLLKLIEEFLSTREAVINPLYNQLHLAKAYRHLRLPKHFRQTMNQARKLHQSTQLRDFDYYEQAFRIEEEEYLFAGYTQRAPENVQELSDMLDIQYLAAKLKQSCLMLSHQTVHKINYNSGLLQEVLNYIDRNQEVLVHAAIALYYYYYRAATAVESELYFQRFKKVLLASADTFPSSEMQDFYNMAINYCVKTLNQQKDNYKVYFRELFELYQEGLKSAVFLEDGILSPFHFKNIVTIALQVKEFDWTSRFIKEYQNYLSSEHRDTYVNFGLSKLRFEQKRYDEALILLQEVDYADIFLHLSSKLMQLKIYYELQEFDVLESFLNSFRTYVNRKKQSGDLRSYHQENYLNIIRLTQKLLTYNPFDKKEKAKLKDEIEKTKVTERKWLLDQLG